MAIPRFRFPPVTARNVEIGAAGVAGAGALGYAGKSFYDTVNDPVQGGFAAVNAAHGQPVDLGSLRPKAFEAARNLTEQALGGTPWLERATVRGRYAIQNNYRDPVEGDGMLDTWTNGLVKGDPKTLGLTALGVGGIGAGALLTYLLTRNRKPKRG